jgi:hypothetical protein
MARKNGDLYQRRRAPDMAARVMDEFEEVLPSLSAQVGGRTAIRKAVPLDGRDVRETAGLADA